MDTTPLAPTPRLLKEVFTVRELLEAITTIILEEPRRLDMDNWVTSFEHLSVYDADASPACGSIGCLAGWGAFLCRPDAATRSDLAGHASRVMEYVLGVERTGWNGTVYRDVGNLFDSGIADEFNEQGDMPAPGTPALAQLVVRRIDAYLRQHPEIANRTESLTHVQTWLRDITTLPFE